MSDNSKEPAALQMGRLRYIEKIGKYGGVITPAGVHYTAGWRDGTAALDDVCAACKEAETLAIARADEIEQLTKERDELKSLSEFGHKLFAEQVIRADALAAQVAMLTWQPIETAPKDGTYILVSNGRGAWVARFKDVYQSGYKPSCPWQSMMLNHDHIPSAKRKGHPTHWMPLPDPEAIAATPADYPECSGDPSDCPENEGYGCCKGNGA